MKNSSAALYRVIWRWHFYAGLFCIPFIIVLSASGVVYLFKPQWESYIEPEITASANAGVRASPNQHIHAALAEFPDALFKTYRLPQENSGAIKIGVVAQGQDYSVYVNPFTLDVLKVLRDDASPMQWAKRIHGELLMGKFGSILVELAACWAIVLMITGIFLWWPRREKVQAKSAERGNSLRWMQGVLYPRTNLSGRSNWKELHKIIGLWLSVFALFLLISGLPWALVWGSALKEIRKLGAAPQTQDWTIKQKAPSWRSKPVETFDLNGAVYDSAISLGFSAPALLSVSDPTSNTWKLSSLNQNRPLRQDAWIDGSFGTVVEQKTFSSKPFIDRVIGIGIAAHEGQLFGWVNQLFGVLTGAGLVFLSVSGFIMWRKRKPSGQLGAPPVSNNIVAQRTVFIVTLGAALLLPLVLASLVILLILEKVVFKQFTGLQRWLCIE